MVSSEWQMPPCFYADVNGKCLHEVANAYTDTKTPPKTARNSTLAVLKLSDLEMKNIHPKLGNEKYSPQGGQCPILAF